MKKAVKSLIIAASVAAIAGIGAVSFAAWSGENTSVETTGGKTANITTIGLSSTGLALEGALVPYDQVEGKGTGKVEEWVVPLTTVGDDIAGYTIQVTHDDSALVAGSMYKVLFNKTETATADVTSPDGYAEIKTAATGTATYDVTEAGTVYAHIILVSGDSTDMDNNVNFTFELVADAA